jgi:hypothetical protein
MEVLRWGEASTVWQKAAGAWAAVRDAQNTMLETMLETLCNQRERVA